LRLLASRKIVLSETQHRQALSSKREMQGGYVQHKKVLLYVHKRITQKSKDVTLLLVTHIDLKIKTSDI